MLLLQSLLITINFSTVANLPTSQSLGYAPSSSLYPSVLFCPSTLKYFSFGIRYSYNHFARIQRRTQPVLLTKFVYRAVAYYCVDVCCANGFTRPLHNNEYKVKIYTIPTLISHAVSYKHASAFIFFC